MKIIFCLIFCFFSFEISGSAQTNLLQNSNAENDSKNWAARGEATIEEFDGNKAFVLRNKASFVQDVMLPENSAGKYILQIAKVSSERVHPDDNITGLPYLYGYLMDDKRVYQYLQTCQGTHGGRSLYTDQWACAWGVYQVPEKADRVRYFLNQAERRGTPQNGSAARFAEVGLYLFDKSDEAQIFRNQFCREIAR